MDQHTNDTLSLVSSTTHALLQRRNGEPTDSDNGGPDFGSGFWILTGAGGKTGAGDDGIGFGSVSKRNRFSDTMGFGF